MMLSRLLQGFYRILSWASGRFGGVHGTRQVHTRHGPDKIGVIHKDISFINAILRRNL